MNSGYGTQIGRKFNQDGTAARYPGNTVIADVSAGNPAYDVMVNCLNMLKNAGMCDLFIHLPEDSYHMTVIRGVNDLVRTEAFWPSALPKDAPMNVVDDYMHRAVTSVTPLGPIRMKFECAVITEEDFRIRMCPADEKQMQGLRCYRNAVADAVGLKLPGHDAYTYHMTLAYTWHLPNEVQRSKLESMLKEMNTMLSAQPEMLIDPPHFAWYRDMLSFSSIPIVRDEQQAFRRERNGK